MLQNIVNQLNLSLSVGQGVLVGLHSPVHHLLLNSCLVATGWDLVDFSNSFPVIVMSILLCKSYGICDEVTTCNGYGTRLQEYIH